MYCSLYYIVRPGIAMVGRTVGRSFHKLEIKHTDMQNYINKFMLYRSGASVGRQNRNQPASQPVYGLCHPFVPLETDRYMARILPNWEGITKQKQIEGITSKMVLAAQPRNA